MSFGPHGHVHALGFHTAVPGETVFASRGLAHGFANPGDDPARYVGILSPSGYEGYFEKVAAYVAENGAMPPLDVVRELMAQHQTILAPPLADPELAPPA